MYVRLTFHPLPVFVKEYLFWVNKVNKMKIVISCLYTLVFTAFAVLLSGKYSDIGISRSVWLAVSVALAVLLILTFPLSYFLKKREKRDTKKDTD